MGRQTHTPLTAIGTKANAYSADVADITMTAADTGNYEQHAFSAGNYLIFAHNTSGASAYDITLTGLADANGRTITVTYSLGIGEYAVFGPFQLDGWSQADGKFYFAAANASVKFGVLKVKERLI